MKIEFNNNQIDLRPTKIICAARNYRRHAEEMRTSVPDEPKIFLKPPSSMIGNNEEVILPKSSGRVDYEVELAVVIKDRCHNIPQQDIKKYILGYTIIVDITARDIQAEARKMGMPWTVAKGFDTFAPIGPRIITADKIDPDDLDISLKINATTRQHSNTKNMIFPVSDLISFISKVMTLEPMDIIATGTPEGVGPLHGGDIVEASIEEVGTLTFKVVKEIK